MNWKIISGIAFLACLSCQTETGKDKQPDKEISDPPEISAPAETPAAALFQKSLEMQGIGFNITANGQTLTITPSGLEEVNDPVVITIQGEVTGAETEDLNADGWPELFVYTQSRDETKQGGLHAFSVFNGKSMGQVSFPPLLENTELTQGYVGGDEFAIVENTLVQRFVLTDGNTRQIQYKLVSGEAMPALVIDKVIEY